MRKNHKKELEEMKKAVYNTQFKIITRGNEDVGIEIKGCQVGTIYKMALTLAELVKMGAIDFDDIDDICDSAKSFYKNEIKNTKKNIHCQIAEIRGDLADELIGLLKQVQKGELDQDDIDFEDFIRRAKEDEDNSL